MSERLTLPQIEALIGAGVEIQAGTGDGWSAPKWKALSNALTKLRQMREDLPRAAAKSEQEQAK
jgi:hypothetical protein